MSRAFGEPHAEGGGVEPQRLMGRSPIWQTVSSTHWQRPPNTTCNQQCRGELNQLSVTYVTMLPPISKLGGGSLWILRL